MTRLSSMTGFASADGPDWSWEARSVNHRGLDLRLRLPSGQDGLEPQIRQTVQARFTRGSVTLELRFEQASGRQRYRVDEAWLDELAEVAGRRGGGDITCLMGLRGVIEAVDPGQPERDEAALLTTLDEVLDALLEARHAEGRALGAALDAHLVTMREQARAARNLAASQPAALRDGLAAAVAALGTRLSEERLVQEVVLLAAKADVREELDRLDAHLEAAAALLASGKAVGRQLDFLCQEIHRETNTLGSKSAALELTRTVLDLKAALEAFREQARNVE